jgi:hypothetical protein
MTQLRLTTTWMSSFLRMEVMIMIDSLSLCLKIRIKNKYLVII